MTHKDKTPMPSMDQIIDFVRSRPFRSKLDLTDGYHNIRIDIRLVKDSVFCCHMGKYDLLVMQQGDCNAPATIMRAMNFLFRNIKDHMIYLDDILIANHTYKEHIKTIRAVMKMAKDNKLWFYKNKCQLMPARMQRLGNILRDQGFDADPDRIDTILKFPTPGNQRQLQRFLGMANYLRQCCPQLRGVAACLSG